MFEHLGRNFFDVPTNAGKEEEHPSEDSIQAATFLEAKNNNNCVAQEEVAVEKEEETVEDPSIFQKGGLALSQDFRIFLSFEKPNGTMKTFQILLEDILKDHGDLSFNIIIREALSILNRNPPKVEEKKIELKYQHLSGKWLSIEVEREFMYALKDFANSGELTIVVSMVEPKQTAEDQAALLPPPTVTPKKRTTKSKSSSQKKAKKTSTAAAAAPSLGIPAAAVTGTHPEAEASMMPLVPIAVKSEDVQLGGTAADATNNSIPAMSGVASRIYNAVGEMHALGILAPQRHHVALLAGYSNVKSTGFSKAMSTVKQQGLIDCPSGSTVALSSKGSATLPSTIYKPRSNDEMKMRLLGVIRSPKAGEIYNYLFDGKVHRRSELAEAVGYTNIKSTGFTKVLSKLGGLGIIHYPDAHTVELTDIAFPYGRPNSDEYKTT